MEISSATNTKDSENLISINNCRIENSRSILLPQINWNMKKGQAWLIIGPNGGGKADFINALAGLQKIIPNNTAISDDSSTVTKESSYINQFADSVELVSLERAARLIQEERENDESDYIEGGVDIGRTGRVFIAQALSETIKKGDELPDFAKKLEAYPQIKLCGVEKILDRGLKYMSTGEIRRTLLARALISGKKLLILSDPFAGLDVQSRTILLDFFNTIASRSSPSIILGMERYHEIPDAITHVLEFKDKEISFCGLKADYEQYLANQQDSDLHKSTSKEERLQFAEQLQQVKQTNQQEQENQKVPQEEEIPLVKMKNVNVGWGDNHVLRDLNWTLNKGEHWLIQGPNGSGKTTFLELITGDNMQVFCNDVELFGKRRGSGETIWDIKKQLGIVSYRLHVEYRMLGRTNLLSVIVSGFKDSIGLYEAATDTEIDYAKKWLKLGGFEGREKETFGSLSYGEQRAILILRSVVKSPKILILDEPCHGLDEQYRNKILNLMETIGEEGSTTMLHVTHDSSEILKCEKHILQLLPGENPMYKIEVK